MSNQSLSKFTYFESSIDGIALPDRFTFPFYYEPHPLSLLATKELQNFLLNQTELKHNFGINPTQEGEVIGKMFGVLVVQNDKNEIGYLNGFSGKLTDESLHQKFVSHVTKFRTDDVFFNSEMRRINEIGAQLKVLTESEKLKSNQQKLAALENEAEIDLSNVRDQLIESKAKRKKLRENEKSNDAKIK